MNHIYENLTQPKRTGVGWHILVMVPSLNLENCDLTCFA